MNRKSFVRSLEAVLAILLFMSFYSAATQNLSPTLQRANPVIMNEGLLDALEQTGVLESLLNTYSLNELNSILKYSLPPTQAFTIELDYFEPLIVKNDENYEVTKNVSFIRPFPDTTNLYSVQIYNNNDSRLPLQIVNNYYKVSITAQASQELFNNTITLDNIHLTTNLDERINTTSMRAYVNNERTSMNLDSIVYNENYYDANASITLTVPEAKSDELIVIAIFYATNESSEIISYPSLSAGIVPTYSAASAEKSRMSEVRFTITLNPNEERLTKLYYELNTESSRTFDNLTINNTNIVIATRDEYYESTQPSSLNQPSTTFLVSKVINSEDVTGLMNLRVWNYE